MFATKPTLSATSVASGDPWLEQDHNLILLFVPLPCLSLFHQASSGASFVFPSSAFSRFGLYDLPCPPRAPALLFASLLLFRLCIFLNESPKKSLDDTLQLDISHLIIFWRHFQSHRSLSQRSCQLARRLGLDMCHIHPKVSINGN